MTLKQSYCVTRSPIEGNADIRAYKRGRAEAVKYRTTALLMFLAWISIQTSPELQPNLFCMFKQRKHTETFALCPRASFSPILGGTYLSVLMGGLLWPQDTGLWTLVVVSMGMSRTWGGIQLTGNTVYC